MEGLIRVIELEFLVAETSVFGHSTEKLFLGFFISKFVLQEREVIRAKSLDQMLERGMALALVFVFGGCHTAVW